MVIGEVFLLAKDLAVWPGLLLCSVRQDDPPSGVLQHH
jgi:hypothetical protein